MFSKKKKEEKKNNNPLTVDHDLEGGWGCKSQQANLSEQTPSVDFFPTTPARSRDALHVKQNSHGKTF